MIFAPDVTKSGIKVSRTWLDHIEPGPSRIKTVNDTCGKDTLHWWSTIFVPRLQSCARTEGFVRIFEGLLRTNLVHGVPFSDVIRGNIVCTVGDVV